MEQSEKIRLLKSLRLLEQIPESQLSTLSEFLKPRLLEAGAVIFEERSKGSSLYFISTGHVRISKQVFNKESKDLAILGPGDCFGEMALIEEVPRSASAVVSASCVVFELDRSDLNRWLKSHPELAMDFFAKLVAIQSRRLRRTSNELTLLYDLSQLILNHTLTAKDLLDRALALILRHLEGSWSAAAYLYNGFNQEMDFSSSHGSFEFEKSSRKLAVTQERRNIWTDSSNYHVFLPEKNQLLGYLIFHSQAALAKEDRNEVGRTLTMVAHLLTATLENINFRTEELLRARLKNAQAYGSRI